MKVLVLFAIWLSCAAAVASDVRWNFVEAEHYLAGETALQETLKPEGSSNVEFSLFFTASASGKNVVLSDFTCNLATAITWVQMVAEDIVYSSAFGDGIPSLFSTEYSGATGEFNTKKDESFFLAFQVFQLVENQDTFEMTRGNAYYGWVEFYVSNAANVEILASAVDLGGGAMIVGGGAAIPEPSSSLLVLVGLAGLALCRRKDASFLSPVSRQDSNQRKMA